MNLGVVGSRYFDDYDLLKSILSKFKTISCIVSGGAKGADILSERYAQEHNIETKIFLPDWSMGRGAGHERNTLIVKNSDSVIAFWDGKSRGTLDSINKCKRFNVPCKVILYNEISIFNL
jgi:hypothetical protein